MKQFCVVLRGAPASGKTTIAKRLRNYEDKVAWLKVDAFKDFFADDATPALEYVHGVALATLEYLLNQGFSVVLDGVFQDTTAIDRIIEVAKLDGVSSSVFQLHCPLDVLLERDKNRLGVKEECRKSLGIDVMTKIWQKLEATPYLTTINLDTQMVSPDECVAKIQQKVISTI